MIEEATLEQDWESVTAEQVREATEADLIPTGTYEALVVDSKPKIVDKPESPYYGVRLARLTFELYGVNGGETKRYWESVTPVERKSPEGKLLNASKLGAQLAKALDDVGVPFGQVIADAMQQRVRVRVRLSPESGQYPARNFTDAITRV